MSMVMRMTGHNGFLPCRMCKIQGVHIPHSQNNAYYVPLDHSSHPTVKESNSVIAVYNPAELPLRTEAEMLRQAREVRDAPSKGQKGHLSMAYGIKGVSLLSNLKSLCFPTTSCILFGRTLSQIWFHSGPGSLKALMKVMGNINSHQMSGKLSERQLQLQGQPFHLYLAHDHKILLSTNLSTLPSHGHFGPFT